MIPELETERMRMRPVRLEDAEQTQKLRPQWEILKMSQSRRHFLVTARRSWRKSTKKCTIPLCDASKPDGGAWAFRYKAEEGGKG